MTQTPAGTPEYTEQHLNAFLDRLLFTADQTVFEHLDLGLQHNAQYDQSELLDLLAHCGLSREFANGGAKTRRHETDGTVLPSDTRCPISWSLGRHLRQLDFDTIMTQFDAVFEELHTLARSAWLLPRQADVAIAVHDWRYYGDPETPWVLHTDLARCPNEHSQTRPLTAADQPRLRRVDHDVGARRRERAYAAEPPAGPPGVVSPEGSIIRIGASGSTARSGR